MKKVQRPLDCVSIIYFSFRKSNTKSQINKRIRLAEFSSLWVCFFFSKKKLSSFNVDGYALVIEAWNQKKKKNIFPSVGKSHEFHQMTRHVVEIYEPWIGEVLVLYFVRIFIPEIFCHFENRNYCHRWRIFECFVHVYLLLAMDLRWQTQNASVNDRTMIERKKATRNAFTHK